MTSFAYAPPVMSSAHFESYSTDSYPDFLQTSQPYPTTTGFTEPSFSAALSTFDSMPVLSAYSDVSNAQESSYFTLNRSESVNAYSPVQSPGEHLAPPRLSSSSESGASVQSTSSSTMASPHIQPQYHVDTWNPLVSASGLPIESNDLAPPHDIYFSPPTVDSGSKMSGYVDPNAINFSSSLPYSTFSDVGLVATSAADYFEPRVPSPVQSQSGKAKSPRMSPYQVQPYHPYQYPTGRRQSTSSSLSRHSSQRSSDSFDVNEVDRERGVCPWPECGRSFKDLKAHMLTHQTERPEKCPIHSCEYHTKGFARKYDKNRHTLTHYKGTMVCGFCPGSGSSVEKSFNRADVFKRHLTSVHGVEQVPPNSRRKSPISGKKTASTPGQAGTCSTCSVTFPSAQEFYEHLDDCVLRVVQQIDPAEAINQKHLGTIAEDKEVKETLDKHNLPASGDYNAAESLEDDEDDDESADNDDANDASYGSRNSRSGKGAIKGNKTAGGSGTTWQSSSRVTKPTRGRTGLTVSKGGVRLNTTTLSGRKKRKNYPASWGGGGEKMKMKKRVLCVYDGQRRLCKDDMMLDSEFEVRLQLPQTGDEEAPFGRPAYVTDLDVQTLKRADAIFGATEEERGPWFPDNLLESDSIEDLLR